MDLGKLFGRSPFEPLVEHARKVHQCVLLVGPIAEAILAGRMQRLEDLQHQMSRTEYEADQLKDRVRQNLPSRYFLPVNRDDVANFLRQMDKIADDAEDFAVVATFRQLRLPQELHADFMTLVQKVVAVSEALLNLGEHLAEFQKEAFSGPDVQGVLDKIQEVCHMEWETDKAGRRFAKRYYGVEALEPVSIILLDKLCRALLGIADHAENVGKNLRLMIVRK